MKKRSLYTILAMSILFAACDNDPAPSPEENPNTPGSNMVVIKEMISQPTVWYGDTIYHLPNGIKVDAALTIKPGTIIKLGSGQTIEVWSDGVINAKGTPDSLIVFTSIKDDSCGGDSNADAIATTPDKGDWANIDLGSSNGSHFAHCKFSYGGNKSYYGTLNLGTKKSVVEYCSFVKNDAYVSGSEYYGALYADEAHADTRISKNLFYNNVVPLSINSHISIDFSNKFENPASPSEKNKYNGIFVHTQDINEGSVLWEETEVAFVISYGSLEIWTDHTLTGNNGDVDPSNGHIDPSWILVTENG